QLVANQVAVAVENALAFQEIGRAAIAPASKSGPAPSSGYRARWVMREPRVSWYKVPMASSTPPCSGKDRAIEGAAVTATPASSSAHPEVPRRLDARHRRGVRRLRQHTAT